MTKSMEGEEGEQEASEVAEEHHQDGSAEEQDQQLSSAQKAQQTEMEEQQSFSDHRPAATPQPLGDSDVPGQPSDVNNLDPERFFKLVADSQSRRMDDQRVSLSLLPGLEIFSSRGSALMNKWESDQLCNFIIRAQSSRLEDQRCTFPQIILTPDSPTALRRSSSRPSSPTHEEDPNTRPLPKSATFSPMSDRERMQYENNTHTPITQALTPAEQERLVSLICQALRGRMEDQRCYLDPTMRAQSAQGVLPQGVDAEQFFKLVAKIQSRRLDDQRVALSFLPGIQTPTGDIQASLTAEETERLYNIISRVQSQRMDEQRCYAPHIQLGTPSPPRRVWSEPDFSTQDPPGPESSDRAPPRSYTEAAINPPAERNQNNWYQNNSNHTAKGPVNNNQDAYFSMVNQAQRWLEEQRRAFDPCALTTDQFFSLVANSQSKRMDDQRASMPSAEGEKPFIPQIILTPGSPDVSRRTCSRPASLSQEPDSSTRPPPRSASFSPVSDNQRRQYDINTSTKLTFEVSVCLTPSRQATDTQQSSHPDVFLMVGPPGGEGFVVPLTPTVCKPTTLEVTPRSRRHHSKSSSPHRDHSRQAHPRPSSPKPAPKPCPISPEEDYFSLIQRVHTAQLQQGNTTEKSRETAKTRGKGDGKRERKDRVKRK